MTKITAREVAALRPTAKAQRIEIDTGLQLRIAPSGVKTWVVRYIAGGRQRDYRLSKPYGPVTDAAHLSLADARAEAAAIRTLARQGIDIQIQAEEQRSAEAKRKDAEAAAEAARLLQEQRENLTFRAMFEAWMADGVRRQDENAELRRSFDADALPTLGDKAIRILNEHDIRAILRAMVLRGSNRAAVVMCNNLKQLIAWAEKRQPWRKLLIEGNPMDLIEIEKIVDPDFDLDFQRERVLSNKEIAELRDILQNMRDDFRDAPNRRVVPQPLEATTERALWIMLSTLCRVGELTKARWEHIDFTAATWFIPKMNVKGKVSKFTVYLSPFALNEFRRLHELTGHGEWCFPAKNKQGSMDTKSISKQLGDRQAQFKESRDGRGRKQMKHRRHDNTLVLSHGANGAWSAHDLRRTGATMMQALGVSLDVIDRCQNHVLPGSKVRRHYLHHDYADEKTHAWRLLGERISLVLQSSENGNR